ncbi:hypothetical protein C7E18_00190 [Stenotrophomonas maltophilia]|nr:hypothetical protein C7E18_00190 [Stenotrophomonas maltophilia]
MYPLFIAAALAISLAIAFASQIARQAEDSERATVQAIASNAAIYLGRAKSYVRSNPTYSGPLDAGAMSLPSWFAKLDGLQGYAEQGKGYVFLTGYSAQQAVDAGDLMQTSYARGVKVAGVVHSPTGDVFNPPAQIPDGAYVIRF